MGLTSEARLARIQAAVDAHDPQQHDRVRMSWRTGSEVFPVVDLELETLVLNPRSHRIRAQLESHPDAEVVSRDPWSDEAQEIIASILRELGDNFDELKTNLDEDGQDQPGVISRFGMLVNANRRAVALRDLGEEYIRVAVLPPDATDDEIDAMELRLQMQKDFREAYTFTNRLLFVDELITKQNRTVDDVARALNIAASSDTRELVKGRAKVEQDTRVLAMVRDVQERSGNKVPLTSFDDKEIALEELDNRLSEIGDTTSAAARELYEVRLLGILSDVPYRDLRRLDADAVDDYVLPIMQEDELLAGVVEHLPTDAQSEAEDDEPGGLDVLGDESGDPTGEAGRKVSSLNDLLATSHDEHVVLAPGPDGPRRLDRPPLVRAVYESLRTAAQEIRGSGKDEDRLKAPAARLAEAERKVRSAGDAYAEIAERSDFDKDAFTSALRRVYQRLQAVATATGEDLEG